MVHNWLQFSHFPFSLTIASNMPDTYDLSHLDSTAFEHLVNAIAMRELGAGHTGFGPGADAGRDGYFEGTAPYPSDTDRWSGVWYLQSKFHKPHLSTDCQKWIQTQVANEIKQFQEAQHRQWPDNWIVATNIDISAVGESGTFDVLKKQVGDANPKLEKRFDVWGGRKILDFLTKYPDIRDEYCHFLTPGHVIAGLIEEFKTDRPSLDDIIRALVVQPFQNEIHTKLEQAGSDADNRPGIHRLFRDLPFFYDSTATNRSFPFRGDVLKCLASASSRNHNNQLEVEDKVWRLWLKHPKRSSTWFVQGGPGQGKSTLGQYFAQIHRAAIILDDNGPRVPTSLSDLAKEVKEVAESQSVWPIVPRIPIALELRDYSHWLATKSRREAQGLLTYIAEHLSIQIERTVSTGNLEKALAKGAWFLICDGLDEVPGDTKDLVAKEVQRFIQEVAFRQKCDLQTLCTSRPQGYSGQFQDLDATAVRLIHLNPKQAFECAKPVLAIGRSGDETKRAEKTLASALESPAVAELMRTPLQSHIMAVVVRDGNKPPERRWQLFNNFYEVIRRREANKDLGDTNIAKLLRENEKLLRSIHNRLGFVLHAEAESAEGATTSLPRERFRVLAQDVVNQMIERDVEKMVGTLVEATTHRLVLVNTPENGEMLRFDVRQLQEFFAAEFLYESVSASTLGKRLEIVAGDSHWREVVHFLLSALIENGRHTELAVAIDVLARLDSAESGPNRVLERRLARGALTASRLFEECVLEQDRRTRQSIRPCLDAACAFTHIDAEHNLSKVTQPNSREWILSYLFEQLKECAHLESVGAAAILLFTLSEEHERWQELEEYFNSSTSEYKDAVFECLHSFAGENCQLHDGAAKIVLRRILDDGWQSLTHHSLGNCLQILTPVHAKLSAIAVKLGFSEEVASLIPHLFGENKYWDMKDIEIEQENFGLVSGVYLKHDWTCENKKPFPAISNVPGILKIPYHIMRFAGDGSRSEFVDALESLKATRQPLLSGFPSKIRSLFPAFEGMLIPDGLVLAAKGMTDNHFEQALKSEKIDDFPLKRWALNFTLDKKGNLNDFVRFIRFRPSVAMHIWFGHYFDDERHFEENEKAQVLQVLGECLSKEIMTCFQFPGLWGTILKSIPNADEVRAKLVAAAKTIVPREVQRHPHPFTSFPLDLPNESSLLPHVLSSLAGLHAFMSWERSTNPNSHLSGLSSAFATTLALSEVASNDHLPLIERGAAIILRTLGGQDAFSLMVSDPGVVISNVENGHSWFVKALSVALATYADPSEESHRRFFGIILDAARSNFYVRSQLDLAVSAWRERPIASLRRSGLVQSWLALKD
ncbi:MAG: hypothetical protein ABL921_23495 [Pirellula sp.]